MKAAIYTGTRNLYKHMIPAIKSLLVNSDVEKIYVGIEDDVFPYELPDLCEVMNLSGQTIFAKDGVNMKSRFTYMAMMRAALVKFLPEDLDRILSLDCDTIVDKDISDIWDLPIDDCYFAASHEFHMTNEKFIYTNVGVCLFNLKKMRDGKADEVIQMLNTREFGWLEQDVLNLLCQGYIYDMPAVYNAHYYTQNPSNPKIIHHIGNNDLLPNYSDVKKYAAMSFDEIMAKRAKR